MAERNDTRDAEFMKEALREAELAAEQGDVPVGAVIVDSETGEIIARGHNTKEQMGTALGHAEIAAIEAACGATGGWRLSRTVLYVTLEPCPMCTGAILSARIPTVVYGAKDPVAGAMGSVWALHKHPLNASRVNVTRGCEEQACQALLQDFFQKKRHE